MKRQGFISIISLIIMSVLLVMVLYLGYISQLEYLILSSSTSEAQGYYQSEGKIYLSLYDEKYYNNQLYLYILDTFRNDKSAGSSSVLIIDDEDLDLEDSEKMVKVKIFEKQDRIRMDLIAASNNNGIVSELTSYTTLVNEIFESDYPVLAHEFVDEIHRDELERILLQISEEISVEDCHKAESLFGVDLDQYNEIILKKRDNDNYDISYKRDTMINPHVRGFSGREAIIIARRPEGGNLNFQIGDPNQARDDMKLSGLIYVNGNLIISDEFEFHGILIVENGAIIVNSDVGPSITGLVILKDMENYDDFIEKTDIILGKHVIYRYGSYLPGFLDPKVLVIKSKLMRE